MKGLKGSGTSTRRARLASAMPGMALPLSTCCPLRTQQISGTIAPMPPCQHHTCSTSCSSHRAPPQGNLPPPAPPHKRRRPHRPQPADPVAALLEQIRTAPHAWLPDGVNYPAPGPWARLLRHAMTWWQRLDPGWLLARMFWPLRQQRQPAAADAASVAVTGGWHVDFEARQLRHIGPPPQMLGLHLSGATPPAHIALEDDAPSNWSLCALPADTPQPTGEEAVTGLPPRPYALELRHARRGPVATLCVVRGWDATPALAQQVDALADTLAQRLGMRRSGAPLAAAHQRG